MCPLCAFGGQGLAGRSQPTQPLFTEHRPGPGSIHWQRERVISNTDEIVFLTYWEGHILRVSTVLHYRTLPNAAAAQAHSSVCAFGGLGLLLLFAPAKPLVRNSQPFYLNGKFIS